MRNIYIILIIFLFQLISCGHNNADIKQDQIKMTSNVTYDAPMQTQLSFHYPMTRQFYNGFLNSTNEFTMIYFYYAMGIDENHPDAPDQNLSISITPKWVPEYGPDHFKNQKLNEINVYPAYYNFVDTNSNPNYKDYSFDLPQKIMLQILQIIQQNGTYYFNAQEYGGEPSKHIASEMQFEGGYRNGISLEIQQTDQPVREQLVFKTFSKGWNPGSNPPPELMPLINYLEGTVIPLMKEHPDPG